jgi:hypothetical protein
MHGEVDLPGEQRLVELFDEQAFAAGVAKRAVGDHVSRRPNRHDLAAQTRNGALEIGADHLGLA